MFFELYNVSLPGASSWDFELHFLFDRMMGICLRVSRLLDVIEQHQMYSSFVFYSAYTGEMSKERKGVNRRDHQQFDHGVVGRRGRQATGGRSRARPRSPTSPRRSPSLTCLPAAADRSNRRTTVSSPPLCLWLHPH